MRGQAASGGGAQAAGGAVRRVDEGVRGACGARAEEVTRNAGAPPVEEAAWDAVEAAPRASRPYGVLGRVLGHSYTPVIYRELAGMDYRRFEVEPEDIESFLAGDTWEGLNVTIPYKRAVLPHLSELSETARRMGNVNTITRLPGRGLRGDNTDYAGFAALVDELGVEVAGKRALVLGHGGAGSTCALVLQDLGARVSFCGRARRDDNPEALVYEDLPARGGDFDLLVNATPVGMFPACPAAPVDLAHLPNLAGVLDIVYNPARTGLVMDAERRGIPCVGGLTMLVAQAAAAVGVYTGSTPAGEEVRALTRRLFATEQNIALIGMPGAGKTHVGRELARLLGREHVDIDEEIEREVGMGCAALIESRGERAFREAETRVLARVASDSNQVISCGGGVVEREGNYGLLHQNSLIALIDRPLEELSAAGRPITARDGIERLAAARGPIYRSWADIRVSSGRTAEDTAAALARLLPAMLRHPTVLPPS
ncbi:MAG: hypothetical protein E7001_08445 [Coriobacteriaceae bacterium]|nr:hypothetical protein [Coriobacteriaceae bacterium]